MSADDNRLIVHSQEDWSGDKGNERHTPPGIEVCGMPEGLVASRT